MITCKTKKILGLVLAITVALGLISGCGEKEEKKEKQEDFSGVWEGTIAVEDMVMPGKMILELDKRGQGTARFGFFDELTTESIDVELDTKNRLKGEGSADAMHFDLSGKFSEEDDEWIFEGNLIINDGYGIDETTVEFFRTGSDLIPDLTSSTSEPKETKSGAQNNSIDFSGEWAGTQLLSEVSGAKAEDYKYMEGLTTECRLVLSLSDLGTGTAQVYFDDDPAGPNLNATAANDRLSLDGLLWGSDFLWNGTFEYDNDIEEWTLTGGGEVVDTYAEATFHIVLSLNLGPADEPAQPTQPTETKQVTQEATTASQNIDVDITAPLEEFLVGSWMGPQSNVMVERRVLALYYDGTVEFYYAKPGDGDTEETWLEGSWTTDEPVSGTWRVEGTKLIAELDIESLSFESEVKVIDVDHVEIEIYYTRSEYRRLPVS